MTTNNTRFYFVLAAIGASVGIGSRWAFPYYSYSFGAWFYLAYLAALLLLAMPLLITEFSFSQHSKKNLVDSFFSLGKWSGWIGWFIVFNAFILMSIYAARLAWHIIYIFVSFGTQWKGKANSYFFNNVLQVSGMADFTKFSLAVFIALILAWLCIYPIIKNGFESLKKGLVWLIPIGAFALIWFFLYGLTLENSLAGIYSLFENNFSVLFSLKIWIAAFSLAAVSIGASFGIMHAISQKTEGFMVRGAFLASLFEFLISVSLGFVLFSLLGLLSAAEGTALKGWMFSEYSSTFTVLSESFVYLGSPTIMSLLFFGFLAVFFLIGAACLGYSVVSVLRRKMETTNRNAAVIVCGFGFLFGLIYAVRPGFFVMDIMSHYIAYNIIAALMLQTFAIVFFGRAKKIARFIDEVSFIRIGKVWLFVSKYFVLPVLFLLLVSQIVLDWKGYKNYSFLVIMVFGLGTVIVPAVIALFMPQRILDGKRSK